MSRACVFSKGCADRRRFRVFFMSCGEFFNLDKGETWGLGHYL